MNLFDLVFHDDAPGPFPNECAMELLSMITTRTLWKNKLRALSCVLSIASWFVNKANTDPESPVIGKVANVLADIAEDTDHAIGATDTHAVSRDKRIEAKLAEMGL